MTATTPPPTQPPVKTERKRSRISPRTIVALVLLALAIAFIAENTRQVKIRVIVPVVSMPLWAALTAMLVIGVVVGAALHSRSVRRSRRD
jgi:uncharacterized integral membrane protein